MDIINALTTSDQHTVQILHFKDIERVPLSINSKPQILHIIRGYAELYIIHLENNRTEIVRLKSGELFEIKKNSLCAQKIKANTTILLISAEPNKIVGSSDDVERWLKEKIVVSRTDYYNNPNAPKVNSIIPAASAAVVNEANRILLLKRKDSGNWTMPGGTLEPNESIKTCLMREVLEETGLTVFPRCIINIYSNPNAVVAYSDGEVRREFSVLFDVKIEDGTLSIDDESTDYGWFSFEDALQCPLANSQRIRINDVIQYYNDKKTSF